MAQPIKETPVLHGRDAERFIQQMKKADQNKVSADESRRMKANYDKIKAIAKF